MNQDSKHISVVIGGRSYNLVVDLAEERTVRDAVQSIDDKYAQMEARYPAKDKQDLLAMTLLTLMVDAMKDKSSSGLDSVQIIERLSALELLADSYLTAN